LQNVICRSVSLAILSVCTSRLLKLTGQPSKIQEPRDVTLPPCQGGGFYWSLERFWTHVRRVLSTRHVQVRSVRDLQGCLHECRRRRAFEQI
jgi:hypothetical protein